MMHRDKVIDVIFDKESNFNGPLVLSQCFAFYRTFYDLYALLKEENN